MERAEKAEWFERFRDRYRRGTKTEKRALLDSLVETLGVHRKSAIRLLAKRNPGRKPQAKRGRTSKYDVPELLKVLRYIWKQTRYMNSRSLHSAIPEWLPSVEKHYGKLTAELRTLLLAISPRSIDRQLKPYKALLKKRGGTKPGSLLKTEIPIQGSVWDIATPGFLEADTVAHCGNSMHGEFVWSLTMTDINTQWTECRAVWHKGAKGVVEQVKDIEKSLPFPMLGFDCDNGSEFLNNYLVAYFSEDKYKKINFAFTRSRAYRKNDNAHVEQKNWTHPRQLFGRIRLDEIELVSMMNDLYQNEFSLLRNHFYPNLKLQDKVRVNSRYRRKYLEPQSPYRRIIEHPNIPVETKKGLIEIHEQLDPIDLQMRIEQKLQEIHRRFKALKRYHPIPKAA